MSLTDVQIDALLQPIAPARVSQVRNSRGRNASHVEAYDIRRRLTNIFGFAGWSGEVLSMELTYESPCTIGDEKKPGFEVGYRCTYRLTVHATGATYTETAFGGQKMGVASRGDCHDFAIKTAESQALKRCAISLGDQFGLSLYNNGSLQPLVQYVLGDAPAKLTPEGVIRPSKPVGPPNVDGTVPTETHPVDVADHITTPLAPEDVPAESADQGPTETSTPPAPADTPARQAADEPDVVDDLRSRALAATKKADLARLLVEAGQHKVAGALTADADGKGMTLEALINARIKSIGRAA